MPIIIGISDFLNSLPLANIAGVLWVSWLIAIVIFLVYARERFSVSHRTWLIAAAIVFTIWRALLTISAGANPIIKRSDLAGWIRLLDVMTVSLLWIWLIITLKGKIIICEHEKQTEQDNTPST